MIRLAVDGPIGPDGLAALCARLRAELANRHADMVVFDMGDVTDPNLGTVDALARARLLARRDGCDLRLADASVELRELLELAGLATTLRCEGEGSGLEAKGQAEGREEARGVQEERDSGDPVA